MMEKGAANDGGTRIAARTPLLEVSGSISAPKMEPKACTMATATHAKADRKTLQARGMQFPRKFADLVPFPGGPASEAVVLGEEFQRSLRLLRNHLARSLSHCMGAANLQATASAADPSRFRVPRFGGFVSVCLADLIVTAVNPTRRLEDSRPGSLAGVVWPGC